MASHIAASDVRNTPSPRLSAVDYSFKFSGQKKRFIGANFGSGFGRKSEDDMSRNSLELMNLDEVGDRRDSGGQFRRSLSTLGKTFRKISSSIFHIADSKDSESYDVISKPCQSEKLSKMQGGKRLEYLDKIKFLDDHLKLTLYNVLISTGIGKWTTCYHELVYAWDLMVMIFILLILIVVPLNAVMPRPDDRMTILFWIINLVFMIDFVFVVLRFRDRIYFVFDVKNSEDDADDNSEENDTGNTDGVELPISQHERIRRLKTTERLERHYKRSNKVAASDKIIPPVDRERRSGVLSRSNSGASDTCNSTNNDNESSDKYNKVAPTTSYAKIAPMLSGDSSVDSKEMAHKDYQNRPETEKEAHVDFDVDKHEEDEEEDEDEDDDIDGGEDDDVVPDLHPTFSSKVGTKLNSTFDSNSSLPSQRYSCMLVSSAPSIPLAATGVTPIKKLVSERKNSIAYISPSGALSPTLASSTRRQSIVSFTSAGATSQKKQLGGLNFEKTNSTLGNNLQNASSISGSSTSNHDDFNSYKTREKRKLDSRIDANERENDELKRKSFIIPDLSAYLLENDNHDVISFFSFTTLRHVIGILIHLAAAMPTEMIGGDFGESCRWLLCLKLISIRRLHKLEQPLVEYNYLYAAYLILQLFAMIFLVGHWSACWWIELIHVDGRHESAFMADGSELYVYSIYLSFLSFMGQDVFAETTKQRLFGLMTLSIGTTMYAVLLGKMAVVLTNVSLTATRQRHKRNLLLETMASMDLPQNLVSKVRKYLQLCVDTKRDLEGINLLRELPDCIYSEIAAHLYSSTILKVPMFRKCKKGFINAVAQLLLPEVHPPGQRIVEAGTVGKEMYFIIQGMVTVETREGTIVALLHGGAFFGEMALLGNGLRTAHVTAVAKTELCLLKKSDLEFVLMDFKEETLMFERMARNRARDLNTAHIKQINDKKYETELRRSSDGDGKPATKSTGATSPSTQSTPDTYSPVSKLLHSSQTTSNIPGTSMDSPAEQIASGGNEQTVAPPRRQRSKLVRESKQDGSVGSSTIVDKKGQQRATDDALPKAAKLDNSSPPGASCDNAGDDSQSLSVALLETDTDGQ